MGLPNIKIGMGYDVHQLVPERDFWLGGIKIEHSHGALGHSDADVLIHAICDALLGALALGDIGVHFSDNDAKYKNIDSKILLAECTKMIAENGWGIGNVDATLMLEAPKISKYVPFMQTTLAGVMGITTNCVSIKATTSEKLGFVGRKEGIEAQAVCLLYKLV